ncbi:MAG: ATP-binding protein [Acidobacteria bacterium]|nr:ATP-binding protein [Acidobacteriota bacterium]
MAAPWTTGSAGREAELKSLVLQGQRIARDLRALETGFAGSQAFDLLASQAQHLARRTENIIGLTVWDGAGWPLSWGGQPYAAPPQEVPAVPVRQSLSLDGGGTVLRIWIPFATGGALLLESRRLTAPARGLAQDSFGAGSSPGRLDGSVPIQVAALLGLALLLIWLARRRSGLFPGSLVVLSAGVWILRAWLANFMRSGAPLDAGVLSSPAVYASQAPFGLFRSPLATLLTGLALTLQAVLIVRATRHPQAARAWRWLLIPAGGAGLAGAFLLCARAGLDSRLDLAGLARESQSAAQLAVQTGLVLTLWAPALLLLTSLFRWQRGRPLLRAALALPLLSALLFMFLARTTEEARQDLVTENLHPLLVHQDADRQRALTETRDLLQSRDGIAQELARALADGTCDALAFHLWRSSELARQGYHSSLEIYDGTGSLAGSFSVAMPPPVAGLAGEVAILEPVPLERLVFSTLSQEQAVLSSRWPVYDAENHIAGVLALYIANDEGNIPALSTAAEPLPWTTAGADTRRLLRGSPLLTVHDTEGTLLWSSQADPAPLRAGMLLRNDIENGIWQDSLSTGHPVRLFYFAQGDLIYALGYPLDPWTRLLAGLLRFVLMQAICLLLLAAVAYLLLHPLAGLRREAILLVNWFRFSWGRKLAAAVLLASLAPLLSLALLLRAPLERQRRESLNTLGLQSLEVARRVVKDSMVAIGGDPSPPMPSDETLYWLSRVIRQDIDLFLDQQLMATSRRGLFTAGIVSPLPDAEAYRRIVLEGKQISLPSPSSLPARPPAVSAALGWNGHGSAMLRLPFSRQEEAVAQAGEEVRERADLATAAVALLLLAAAILVGRTTARRLQRLTRATARLAAGEEDFLVPLSGQDELSRLTGSFNDMATTLTRQRADLRRRTETLENLVRHAPMGIIHLDATDVILMLNPAAERIMAGGEHVEAGRKIVQALGSSPYNQGLSALIASPRAHPDSTLTRDLEPDTGHDTRLRAILVDLPDERGDRLLLLEDITESVRSSRLEAWADMARRIAHEIKNPLTPIRLAAEHLRRVHQRQDPEFSATVDRTVATILTQVEGLREIASTFSHYARLPEKKTQLLSPGDLLADTLAPYGSTLGPQVRLEVDIATSLPPVRVDPDLIKRAIVNLIENALQAMPTGGELWVRASTDEAREMVLMEIKDTGMGMDEKTLARIFEPYFSTRDSGTGLGMAIALRTIQEHGGRLEATSEPGQGTTFTISLPAAEENSPTS